MGAGAQPRIVAVQGDPETRRVTLAALRAFVDEHPQCVEADAECTARWVAWHRWRGAAPADAQAEAEYAALVVLADGVNDGR